jgi:hypothetical protein
MREERAAALMSKLLGMLPQQCRRPKKPHKDDNKDKKQLEVITTTIVPNWTPPSSQTVIKPQFGVPMKTCCHRKEQLEENHSSRPWNREVHAPKHRQFTDEEEAGIADMILRKCIAFGRLFTSPTFREVAQKAFETNHSPMPTSRVPVISFTTSRQGINSPLGDSIRDAEIPLKPQQRSTRGSQESEICAR